MRSGTLLLGIVLIVIAVFSMVTASVACCMIGGVCGLLGLILFILGLVLPDHDEIRYQQQPAQVVIQQLVYHCQDCGTPMAYQQGYYYCPKCKKYVK